MIKGPTTEVGELVACARRYAALSAEFDPVAALACGGDDPDRLVEAGSALAAACDVHVATAVGAWLMRTSERRYELKLLDEEGRLPDAISARRGLGTDAATEDLLAALSGAPPFSPAEIETQISNPSSRQQLERIILALDRAGPIGPGYSLLDTARRALAAWDRRERRAQFVRAGFVGRDSERKLLLDWIRRPARTLPVKALFLSGLPGIGKSWLLEEAVRTAHDQGSDPIVVRLDFDRAGLDVTDQVGLTMEVARQVADRISEGGAALLASRLDAASLHPDLIDELRNRSDVPGDLAAKIATAVQTDARPIVIVLDTLEVLRARGESHPRQLFEWLDKLVSFGVAPMSVIAAGRGDALDSCKDRINIARHLDRLDRQASEQLLVQLGTAPELVGKLADLADGNPLALRLGARIVDREGGAFLEKQVRGGLSASYLYRFLLSRISDPVLRKLAHPGLVVRRISPEVISEVLAPHLGLGGIDPELARTLFDALRSEHWLVEADVAAPGFVKHRSDMRRALLPLLYRDKPSLCARIDEAATRWFAARPEEWCQVEAVYHRLQLMRTKDAAPHIDPAKSLQFDADMVAELPPRARDVVLASRGERTGSLREGSTGQDFDRGLASELLAVVERADWSEGQYLVDRAVESGLDPRHEPADAVRAFYWRCGRWSEARNWLRERDRFKPDDDDLDNLAPALRIARMEMRAEFAFERLHALIGRRPDLQKLTMEESWRAAETRAFGGALIASVAEHAGDAIPWDNPAFGLFGAARDFWRHDGLRRPPEAKAIEAMAARLSRRLNLAPADLIDAGPPGMARQLSVDTCFEGFIQNLDRVSRGGGLARQAGHVDRALSAVGGLVPDAAPAAPVQPFTDQPIGGIAAMGLLAEWVEAQGFLDRDPDLRLIGRSAALWRRTMAGQWAYGRGRHGWAPIPLDVSLEARVRALASAADPIRESRRQLGLWFGEADDLGPATQLLKRRLGKAIGFAARIAGSLSGPPGEAAAILAAALLRRRVPAAFVPAIAVLVENGEH